MKLLSLACCAVWMLAACGGSPTSTSCATDSECAVGSFCEASNCRAECQADLDCEVGALGICDTARGRCTASSADGGGDDASAFDGGGPDASSSCDEDDDGQESIACGGADCDDDDRAVFSGAVEVCSPSDLSSVTRDENCDPSDRGVQRVGTVVSIDADGDGYASALCCNAAGATMLCGDDCDDSNPRVYPGRPDLCGDGIDQDCDGLIDEIFRDSDNDGRGDPAVSTGGDCMPGWVSNDEDCDDTSQLTFVGARERCDGRDNDCSLPGAMAGGPDASEDADGDGHSPLGATCLSRTEIGADALGSELEKNDCNDTDATIYAGADEICGNGIDEDCNGTPDDPSATVYRDADGDGHGNPAVTMAIMSCVVPTGWSRLSDDCDDANASRYAGAPEICDRIDNNCSTPATLAAVDEDVDGDAHSPTGAVCIGDGEPGAPASAYPKDDCDDASAAVHGGLPASADMSTCDGLDNDCDPVTTELGLACPSGGFCNPRATCGPM